MNIILCMSHAEFIRVMGDCPACERRRRHVRGVEMWHDSEWICCTCGYSDLASSEYVGDPERAERAKQLWRDARPAAEVWAELEAEAESYRLTDDELDEIDNITEPRETP